MAYFPNGSAGDNFTEHYCMRCVNWRDNGSGTEGCPIIDLHMLWNYDAVGKNADKTKAAALNHFIPESNPEQDFAGECVMFQMPPQATQRELERAGQGRLGL